MSAAARSRRRPRRSLPCAARRARRRDHDKPGDDAMTENIILASSSPFRKALLDNAGVDFRGRASRDRRARGRGAAGRQRRDAGGCRAGAGRGQGGRGQRAQSRRAGASARDQTLSLGDEVFHKPADMEGARRHLLALSGKTHQLNSAVVLVRDGETLWRTCRDRAADHARARRRLSSAAIWRASATRRCRASAPTRSRARASSCSRRSKATISPSSACRCCRCWPQLRELGAIDG